MGRGKNGMRPNSRCHPQRALAAGRSQNRHRTADPSARRTTSPRPTAWSATSSGVIPRRHSSFSIRSTAAGSMPSRYTVTRSSRSSVPAVRMNAATFFKSRLIRHPRRVRELPAGRSRRNLTRTGRRVSRETAFPPPRRVLQYGAPGPNPSPVPASHRGRLCSASSRPPLLACGLLAAPAPAADPPKADKPADPPKAEKADANPDQLGTTQAINLYIAQGWEKAGIKTPAAKAPDSEFLRRCFLDLIGRIATPEEVLDFEQDKAKDKRAKLVKRLLYGVPQLKDGKPVLDKEGKPVAGQYAPRVDGKAAKGADGKELSFDYPAEYAEHWANVWTVLLMSRTTHPKYREQMQAWLWQQYYDNRPYHEMVKDLVTATGSSNRNGAVNFVMSHLGDKVAPANQKELGHFDAVPVTSRVTKLFLGLQTQCTQCHDHPFNKEWLQSDFWGVNAFFRQTTRNVDPTPRNARNNGNMMLQDKIEVGDDAGLNADAMIHFERRNGSPASVRAAFLWDFDAAQKMMALPKRPKDQSDKRLRPGTGGSKSDKTRREQLAEFLVAHDNFAPAAVNRLWGHLFGRGLNKEAGVDDFGSNNEVVHEDLLKRLAADFVRYNYDPKQMLDAICNSDVYQLGHVAAKGNEDAKFDAFFARMPLKAMSPEVLFESLTVATKSDAAGGDKQTRAKLRDDWMSKLVQNFGDDEGNESSFNGTVIQALLMMNGKEINKEITRGGGVVDDAVKKHTKGGAVNVDAVLDDLFLSALNRHATKAELVALKDIQDGTIAASREDKKDEPKTTTPKDTKKPDGKDDPKKDDPKPAPKPTGTKKPEPKPAGTVIAGVGKDDKKFYQDVFWALLNTTEFMLNH